MTYEELVKAQKDQEWLVCNADAQIRLVRAKRTRRPEEVSTHYWDATLCDTEGVEFYADVGNLRLATPNDMLKYGE